LVAGRLDLADRLFPAMTDHRWDDDIMEAGIESGRQNVIDYLLERGFQLSPSMAETAASSGNITVLRQLVAMGDEKINFDLVAVSLIQHNHYHSTLDILAKADPEIISANASYYGRCDLREAYPWSESNVCQAFRSAGRRGDLALMREFMSKFEVPSFQFYRTFADALGNNRLDVMILASRRLDFRELSLYSWDREAGHSGCLDLLEAIIKLRGSNFSYDAAISGAASRSHMELLGRLSDNSLEPWQYGTTLCCLSRTSQYEAIEWLAPRSDSYGRLRALEEAIPFGHLFTVKLILGFEKNVTRENLKGELDMARISGHRHILEYFD
jgi:hypothetical protein